jgi:tRNA(Ile)-lysidine synthase
VQGAALPSNPILAAVTAFPALVPLDAPLLVGYSGGVDSTVLLHWLWRCAQASGTALRAVHVHHGLQPDADDWVLHCQQQCAALGIELAVHRVQVDNGAGLGLEGAARQARRAAFAAELRDGETLALAQHQDDQAETFLLRALRGSGVDGLAAMSAHSRLGEHPLWRPLLAVPRSALLDYARQHALRWIEDPSNGDDHADRNFLRLQVLPLLRQRWPHAAAALAGSATHCRQTRELLDEEDAELIAHLEVAPRVLSLPLLRQVSPRRAARVLRAWVVGHGAAPLPATVLQQALDELLPADNDRQARVRWQRSRHPAMARPRLSAARAAALAAPRLAGRMGWPCTAGIARRRPAEPAGRRGLRTATAGPCTRGRRAHPAAGSPAFACAEGLPATRTPRPLATRPAAADLRWPAAAGRRRRGHRRTAAGLVAGA